MTLIPKGGHPGVAIALGLVGGVIALVSGISLLDRPNTIAAWLLIVGGVLMLLGAGLTSVDVLRKRRRRQGQSDWPLES